MERKPGRIIDIAESLSAQPSSHQIRLPQDSEYNNNFANQAVVTLNNVEQVEVQAFNNNITLNATNWNGVETIASVNGNRDVKVNNLNAIVDAEMRNTNGDLTLNYRAAVVNGANDVQNVAVNGAGDNGSGIFTADGIETMNVSVTGSFEDTETNDVWFRSTTLKTLNISGDGNLVTDVQSSVKTLDASAATGNIEADVSATNKIAVTGGSGDDAFNFAATLGAGDSVDGGAGFDTVSVDGANYLAASATKTALNAMTSVEQIEFTGGTAARINHSTLTNADVTHILFNTTGGTDTVGNALSAATYSFGDANTGNATFDMRGGNTELNVVMLGSDPLQAEAEDGTSASVNNILVNLAAIDAGSQATINILSSGDLPTLSANSINNINAVEGSTVNITGDADLDIGSFTNAAIVDASALTGDLVIEGSQWIAFGTDGNDVITFGQGQNTVTFDSGADSGVFLLGNSYIDEIINFTAGSDGDLLDANILVGNSGYAAISAANQAAIDALSGGGATFIAAANIASQGNLAADTWTAFTFQGETYALYDQGGGANNFSSGNDLLVQLTGVAVADLTADNFA